MPAELHGSYSYKPSDFVKKKLLIALVPLVLAGFVAYKMLAPKAPEPKVKVQGNVYVLPKAFLINLRDGQFARLSVALVIDPSASAGGHGASAASAKPPEGYGDLPQEALVRSVITNAITGQPAARLTTSRSREALKKRIRNELKRTTDVHATSVLITDVAVQ